MTVGLRHHSPDGVSALPDDVAVVGVGHVHLHGDPAVGGSVQDLRDHHLCSGNPLLSSPPDTNVRIFLTFGSNLQSGGPNHGGLSLDADPLEKLCSSLTKLWRVGHHNLQLLSVHPEPLLVVELLLALAVDVLPAALAGQSRAAVVHGGEIPHHLQPRVSRAGRLLLMGRREVKPRVVLRGRRWRSRALLSSLPVLRDSPAWIFSSSSSSSWRVERVGVRATAGEGHGLYELREEKD